MKNRLIFKQLPKISKTTKENNSKNVSQTVSPWTKSHKVGAKKFVYFFYFWDALNDIIHLHSLTWMLKQVSYHADEGRYIRSHICLESRSKHTEPMCRQAITGSSLMTSPLVKRDQLMHGRFLIFVQWATD